MKKRSVFVWAAVGLSVFLAACSGGKGSGERYLTETVKVADIEKTVLGTGVLQPQTVIDVGAQASGQIQSLKVDVGDRVKAGDVIAIIDPATQQTTLRNAEATQAQAAASKISQEATIERSGLEFNRQQELLNRGVSSRSQFEQADASLRIANAQLKGVEAQIRQAQANYEKAQVDLAHTTITAPISGVVASVLVRQGQTVNSIQTAPTIVRLAKLDVMTVRAQISEADVIGVHAGQKVYFKVLGDPDRKYYATLRSIDPAPDNSNQFLVGPANAPVYYNAVFDVPNPDGTLRPGMTAEVSVVLEDVKQVLTMPAGALREKQADGSYKAKVMVGENKTEERRVRIGVNNNVQAQVLDGLKEGDKVVVSDVLDGSVTALPKTKGRPPWAGK
ncbi:MAG: efflux RND transporter periplasmic adaptor subunit [Alphaproteobacteria bacterium]